MFLSQNIKVQLLTFYLMIGPNLNEKIHDRYMTLLSLQTHSSPHLRTTRSIIVGSLYSVMETYLVIRHASCYIYGLE